MVRSWRDFCGLWMGWGKMMRGCLERLKSEGWWGEGGWGSSGLGVPTLIPSPTLCRHISPTAAVGIDLFF